MGIVEEFHQAYPTFNLEAKVDVNGEGNVRKQIKARDSDEELVIQEGQVACNTGFKR